MKNQHEIDALIIQSLAEIEQANARIEGPIKEELERETAKLLREVTRETGWYCKADSLDDDFWMAKPSWKLKKGEPDHKADHLLFAALDWDSTRKDVSWIGQFVGSQGSRLLLKLDTDKFSNKRWAQFLEESPAWPIVQELGDCGLRLDQNNPDEPFAVPVTLDPRKVASAFSREVRFEDAFEPLVKTLRGIIAKEELLDELAEIVRRARS